MIQIEIVGLPDIDRRWALVVDDVVRCLRKAPMEIGPGDIWTSCRSGLWLLIIAHDGEKIHGTTVWRFTANHYFECVILTGRNLKGWFPGLINAAEAIAKAHDCCGLIATGRPEFSSFFKKNLPRAKAIRITHALEF